MVRIRPGRSWRVNPGYLGQLQALSAPHARRFDASSILDVVGIEIDGVDIAAGIGEAQVLLAVAELAEALVRLGAGEPAAQATVGPGPTEVLLEARGGEVALTLVHLSRPARVQASGLLVDGARLRAAALQAAQGLLGDLLEISPALRSLPVCKRLSRAAQQLARKAAPTRAWPPAAVGPSRVRALVMRGGRGALRCEVQVPIDAAERLGEPIAGAPLASLLARGTLTLRIPGAPAASFEGPLFLALRDAVHSAEALVHAWEAGDRACELTLGPTSLRFDLTRDEVRAEGFTRPAAAPAPQVALALAAAARTFASRALELAPEAAPPLEPLRDLVDAAGELIRHCRDLASGALRRAPDAVAAPPLPSAPPLLSRPLSPSGRVRRLVYREAFRARLAEEVSALLLCGSSALAGPPTSSGLWVLAGGEARGFELATGRALPALPCAGPRAAVRALAGGDLFVVGPEALVRIDPASGQLRWRRKLAAAQGPLTAAFALPEGVLVATRGSLALVGDGGQVAWRSRLEDPPRAALAHESVLWLSMPSGVVAALDAQTGRALLRRRQAARVGPPVLCGGRLIFAAQEPSGPPRLVALEAATGNLAWQIELPAPAPLAPPVAAGDLVAMAAGDGVLCARIADGARRFFTELPWGASSQLAAVDEPEDAPRTAARRKLRGPAFLAAGPGGALLLLGANGDRAWSIAPRGDAPPTAPLVSRGVVISASAGLHLHDALEGLPLAQLGLARPALFAAGPDLTVAVVEGGELAVHRLTTHLSVV